MRQKKPYAGTVDNHDAREEILPPHLRQDFPAQHSHSAEQVNFATLNLRGGGGGFYPKMISTAQTRSFQGFYGYGLVETKPLDTHVNSEIYTSKTKIFTQK